MQLEEAAKVEAKRLEIADRVAAMAKEVEAAAARRLTDSEAALQRRSAATAAAASGAPPADAADPAQAEAADEEMAAEGQQPSYHVYSLCIWHNSKSIQTGSGFLWVLGVLRRRPLPWCVVCVLMPVPICKSRSASPHAFSNPVAHYRR